MLIFLTLQEFFTCSNDFFANKKTWKKSKTQIHGKIWGKSLQQVPPEFFGCVSSPRWRWNSAQWRATATRRHRQGLAATTKAVVIGWGVDPVEGIRKGGRKSAWRWEDSIPPFWLVKLIYGFLDFFLRKMITWLLDNFVSWGNLVNMRKPTVLSRLWWVEIPPKKRFFNNDVPHRFVRPPLHLNLGGNFWANELVEKTWP